ncbi:hypothetical protein ES705_25201 [subsurface metagenome]
MLVCVLKEESEKECDAEIVKYVDRIWLDTKGTISCIRQFIVSVPNGSKPLTRIRMLIPFKRVLELKDLSGTLLDKNYVFNSLNTGNNEVNRHDPIKKIGNIKYDDFQNVEVLYDVENLLLSTSVMNQASLIEIQRKDNGLQPGNLWVIRLSFVITLVWDLLFEDNYLLEFEYFNSFKYKDELSKLGNRKLEIPLRKIFNSETKQGGADIFLYLLHPLQGRDFNSHKETVAKHMFEGKEGEQNYQKFVWRGRIAFPDDEFLKLDKTSWQLKGYAVNPSKRQEAFEKINKTWKETLKNKRWVFWSFMIAIISALLALASMCISFSLKP